ncbi:MAG: homocysteine S-methyltransferase family protein [Anaerolineales bacterium]|nr:homocysteine S-methyltransferase family protein [Anaerolineales bacterium]
MEMSLKGYLASGRVLIADGATGTMLMAAGLPAGAAPEIWNIEAPVQIMALHQTYLEAGSQIILSNSFGGSPIKLAKYGLAERAVELNHAAASLARQAAGDRAYVAGDIGPTGELMEPLGELTPDTAFEAFKLQAEALVEGGVDALWIETMSDLEEARAAVLAAKQVTHLPVFCSLSFGIKSRTMMGVSAGRAAAELWPLGLAAVGANCGEGLDMIPEVLRQMREAAPDAVLIAKPNAGLPRIVGKETVYDVGPDDFARQMQGFVELGARVVGSCCGSNPEYIGALTAALAGQG